MFNLSTYLFYHIVIWAIQFRWEIFFNRTHFIFKDNKSLLNISFSNKFVMHYMAANTSICIKAEFMAVGLPYFLKSVTIFYSVWPILISNLNINILTTPNRKNMVLKAIPIVAKLKWNNSTRDIQINRQVNSWKKGKHFN